MKYIYFDCYAGFDVQMALGSLLDMTKDTTLAKKTAADIAKEVTLCTEEVKRQSMEALLVYFDLCVPECESISELIDSSGFDDDIKSKLRLWHKIKSDGKPQNFENEFKELVYAAACLAVIKQADCEAVYVSAITQGSGVKTSGDKLSVIPSPHTELLCKMADIHTIPSSIEKEILTPGGIALLYVLGAKHIPPKAHNVIKSGYGAGCDKLAVPNILRCIIADETQEEQTISFEAMLSQMCNEFGVLAKNE